MLPNLRFAIGERVQTIFLAQGYRKFQLAKSTSKGYSASKFRLVKSHGLGSPLDLQSHHNTNGHTSLAFLEDSR